MSRSPWLMEASASSRRVRWASVPGWRVGGRAGSLKAGDAGDEEGGALVLGALVLGVLALGALASACALVWGALASACALVWGALVAAAVVGWGSLWAALGFWHALRGERVAARRRLAVSGRVLWGGMGLFRGWCRGRGG
jgi:hypothetical protein